MKKTLLLLLILADGMLASAQADFRPGYIIRLTGDSIPGFVNYRRSAVNEKTCLFKETKRGKVTRFKPEEIKGFGIPDGKHYKSTVIPVDTGKIVTAFAEKLIKGKVNLYKYNREFYFDEDNNRIVKLPKRIVKRIQTENGKFNKISYPHITILNGLLAPCGLNANKTAYEERDVVATVEKYNSCKGVKSYSFKKNTPWTRVHWQVFSGLNVSSLELENAHSGVYHAEGVEFKNSYSIYGGIGLDISSPRINDKTFISIEFHYMKKFYQGYAEVLPFDNISYTHNNDYLFDVSFLRIPIGLKFNLLSDDKTPYIRAGWVQYFMRKASFEILTEVDDRTNGTVHTADYFFDDSRTQIGFWGALGFTKRITPGVKAFAEVRFETANGFVGGLVSTAPSSFTKSIDVLIGFRF